MNYDIKITTKDVKINWIELAYLAAKNGANSTRILQNKWIILLNDWKTAKVVNDLTANLKYYPYYLEAYNAVLSGFVGKYDIEVIDDTAPGGIKWVQKYGFIAFSPIA